ncbi:response regulator [Methanobacterium sp.]|uniref:response regulator n=1 Tax=Methanobacterium sp. TaxID=2164 RepID=UPI003158C5C1
MPLNVLIVENELIIALDIKQRLKSMGHNVVDIVSSGENALKVIKKYMIDLIIMDAHLNGALNGIDTAIYIRKKFNMPILYISASFNLERHAKIRLTEPYEHIKKPFDNEQLQTAITTCLNKSF